MTLGEKIRHHRKRLDISARKLSEIMDVSYGTVLNWEKDVTEPTFFYAVCLSDILGVSLNYLAGKEKLSHEI